MFNLEANIPQTVRNYLSNEPALRGVRMSVDALLELGLDHIPSIEWEELTDFYKARTAAELTKLEWSIAMHNLWQYIWGDNIAPHWKISPVTKLADDVIITIEECWESAGFIIEHQLGKIELYTAIEIRSTEIVIAFGLERGRSRLIKGQVDGFEWSGKKSVWEDYNVARFDGNFLENIALLEDARSAAVRALTRCDELSAS